jgi:hypothetical protein
LQVRETAWPADFERREIWAKGRVAKSPAGDWRLKEADSRLSRLGDQLGKEVKLDGAAWALNHYWWFEYCGEKLYVENQKNLPGWKEDFWGASSPSAGFSIVPNFPTSTNSRSRAIPACENITSCAARHGQHWIRGGESHQKFRKPHP